MAIKVFSPGRHLQAGRITAELAAAFFGDGHVETRTVPGASLINDSCHNFDELRDAVVGTEFQAAGRSSTTREAKSALTIKFNPKKLHEERSNI